MSLEKKYIERLEELRLEAFKAVSKLVDTFVEEHFGDKPSLVQYAITLEFIEAICSFCVIRQTKLDDMLNIIGTVYAKYQHEIDKKKEGDEPSCTVT